MVLLSVIVPIRNAADTLVACLDGLRAQQFPRDQFEIILVDNNSTDSSASIARRYPDVQLLSEPKPGAYAARNRGVAAARGHLLAFTDPDCVPAPDWLATLARELQVVGTAVVMGGYILPSHNAVLELLIRYENTKDAFVLGTDIPELYYGHTNNMGVRREIFDRFGPFVERHRGADTIFVRRVVADLSCDAVRYAPAALVEHLEVDRIRTYYRKLFLYGESRESYRHISWTRPLSLGERMVVFRRACTTHALSVGRTVLLFGLLSLGLGAWRAGRARAQWSRWRARSVESAAAGLLG